MKLLFDKDHKRVLTSRDFDRARIPARLCGATVEAIPKEATYRVDLTKYLDDIDQRMQEGTGILFVGSYGGGKSASSIIVAKEVMSRGGSALFIEENDLIGVVLKDTEYSDDVSMEERAEGVDLLIVDDVGLAPHTVNLHVTQTLIKHRIHRRKTTIITTNLTNKDFEDKYRTIFYAIKEATIPIRCDGVAWREKIAEELMAKNKQKGT